MHGVFQRCGIEAAAHGAPAFLTLDQARTREHVEVLHHRRQRHGERCGDLCDRQLAFAREAIEDGAAGRVGQRGKRHVEPSVLIVNHTVKYRASQRRCQETQRRLQRSDERRRALARVG